jgi:hypothetical protein
MRTHSTTQALVATLFGALVACNAILGIPEAGHSDGSSSSGDDDDNTKKGNCADNQKSCGGKCVGLEDPTTGCGNTDCQPCPIQNATGSCTQDGRCSFSACKQGFKDCNKQPDDGCETDVSSDKANCGECGTQCAGQLSCNSGNCNCQSDAECRAQNGPGRCALDTHICHCPNDGECNAAVVCNADGDCVQN